MFFYEGYTCPVCGKAFIESDDIVACPECGAPHHRTCWQREGHCHFVADHGTSRQWSRGEAEASAASATQQSETAGYTEKVCPYCGSHNPEFAEFCSRCGRDLPSGDWTQPNGNHRQTPPNHATPPYQTGGYSPYGAPTNGAYPPPGRYSEYSPYHVQVADPYGGVPHDETIEDVPAKDVLTAVGANSAYYLPQFYKMSKTGSKISWNWPAFLLTPYWLLYRKNYLAGGLVLFLSLASAVVQNIVLYVFLLPDGWATMDSQTMVQALTARLMENEVLNWILLLLMFLDIVIRLMFGLTGNYVYMRSTLRRVRGIRKRYLGQDNYYQHLATSGGISFLLGVSAYAILWFVNTYMVFIL